MREAAALSANFDLILRSLKSSVASSAAEAKGAAHGGEKAALESHLEAHDNFLMDCAGCNEPGDGGE